MIKIDWNEFKSYKQSHMDISKKDNFLLLKEFITSYYNLSSYFDIYDMLRHDELSSMMLEKRNIDTPEALERYFKR
ncbi:MAG: hypothetical protein U9P71_08625 [Campylobacterota bacterium]|nr:hypothetical protein [Campylobacterota bacterium]